MTVIESIVRDLHGMPMRKLVEVARYVHRLSETAERERAEVLGETHGYLSEEDARIFEQASQHAVVAVGVGSLGHGGRESWRGGCRRHRA